MGRIFGGIALWAGLAAGLFGLRRAVLTLGEWLAEPIRPGRALWRASTERGEELVRAAGFGLAAAVLLALAARAGRAGRIALSLCALAVVAACLLGLPGKPPAGFGDPRLVFALSCFTALVAVSLILAAFWLLRREAAEPGQRPLVLCALALLSLVAATGVEVGAERCAPRVVRREHVRMLPMLEGSERGGWEVLERHPAYEPAPGVIAPVPRPDVDGQDLPSIVMPPPCELRFEVLPEDGPVSLHLAAGIDDDFVPRRHPEIFPPSVLFEVRVDGELVFSESVDPVYRGSDAPRAWRWVGGEEGLALRPGQEVRLRTALASPTVETSAIPRIPAGFGRVRLERVVESPVEHATAERPNIVLVVQDTLRADRLSCYGYEQETSPALDALAARGLLFENAYAASSWTWPSTASLLTGLWPEVHQVVSDGACYLATELDTLAEVLARKGYVTAAFVGNPLILPQRNFDQGFHHFDPPPFASFRKTDAMLPAIEAFLDAHGRQRFFLYLHLVDVHWPYEPTPETRRLAGGEPPEDYPPQGIVDLHQLALKAARGDAGDGEDSLPHGPPSPEHLEWARREYLAAVATGDHWLGRILAALDARGLTGKSLIVFTSDHGEELFDHGLGTHGHALWEELVRAPLVIAGPGVPVGRVRTPVSNRHVGPTLAAAGGTRLDAVRRPLDLRRPDAIDERPVYFSTEQGWWEGDGRVVLRGLRQGSWSVVQLDSPLPSGERIEGPRAVRLFDLARDPGQSTDLVPGEEERLDVLRETIRAHVTESEERRTTRRLGAGASTRKMLKAIGYTGDEDE